MTAFIIRNAENHMAVLAHHKTQIVCTEKETKVIISMYLDASSYQSSLLFSCCIVGTHPQKGPYQLCMECMELCIASKTSCGTPLPITISLSISCMGHINLPS